MVQSFWRAQSIANRQPGTMSPGKSTNLDPVAIWVKCEGDMLHLAIGQTLLELDA
jgi:hypothetical protein